MIFSLVNQYDTQVSEILLIIVDMIVYSTFDKFDKKVGTVR